MQRTDSRSFAQRRISVTLRITELESALAAAKKARAELDLEERTHAVACARTEAAQ
jgi:hypothetical protein